MESPHKILKIEPIPRKKSFGGARSNAGRKKGGMNADVKARKIAFDEFRNRVLKSKSALMNAQLNLAEGCQMLFRIDKDEKGHNKKPELVTSQSEIENYLAGEYDGDSYYFITTERPDNKAIDSLFDRTFGKAVMNVDLTSGGEKLNLSNLFAVATGEETDEEN